MNLATHAMIDLGTIIGTTGLSLDIAGAIGPFCCASTKNIEREIAYRMMRDVTEEAKGGEWVHSISFEEHQRKLARTKQRVAGIRRLARFALGTIVVGFVPQLAAMWM